MTGISISSPDRAERLRRMAETAAAHRGIRRQTRSVPSPFDDLLVIGIWNVPAREDIDIVKAAFPAAGQMLERWAASWNAVFGELDAPLRPDGSRRSSSKVSADRNEIAEYARKLEKWTEALDAETPVPSALLDADYFLRHGYGKFRDFLHHYVDDAAKFLALGEAEPGTASFYNRSTLYIVEGLTDGGLVSFRRCVPPPPSSPAHRNPPSRFVPARGTTVRPPSPDDRFAGASIHDHVNRLANDDDKYWHWPAMQRALGRSHIDASTVDEAVDILFGMASDGVGKAFVKAASSKGGTWTVDLSGIFTRADMERRYQRDLFEPHGRPPNDVVIQEHTPFTREQRFFVRDGRVVSSVCSDRNMNPTHTRAGRRLDDRVAVIDVPEVDDGAFDRGHTSWETDRALAAAFARRARAIVRDMAAEGRTTYVVDMGATADGVIRAVEVNCFYRSGPYCLDQAWIVRSHARKLAKARASSAAVSEPEFLMAAE